MPDITLTTRRLKLLALNETELGLALNHMSELERLLKLPIITDVTYEAVHRALGMKLAKMARAPKSDHPWYTYWLMVAQDEQGHEVGIGLMGFKGAPDAFGRVEIGYGMAPEYQGRGLMSETVRALLSWAFDTPRCQAVTAETLKDNFASIRVLERVGFQQVRDMGDNLVWVMERSRWQFPKQPSGL